MTRTLRVITADDERPARAFLGGLLRTFPDVELVGEADGGHQAVRSIEQLRPDLALLDLQMPEIDGLSVVRLVRKPLLPLVAFVTAYDEYAVSAFELNAVDYLLKPVEPRRLRETIDRAHERLGRSGVGGEQERQLRQMAAVYHEPGGGSYLRRIPVRTRDDILVVAVDQIASVVADGELLHLHTLSGQRYTITYRLKDLEARLDPQQFVRLSRGAIANLDALKRVSPMPGGTYVVTLANKQQLAVSRSRARALREQHFRL